MNLQTIGGLVLAVFGAHMLRHALRNHRKALASVAWPAVEGTVTKVELWGRRNVGGEMKEVEHLSVAYEYRVDGREYSGTRVAFHRLHFPETTDFASGHPVGSRVEVFHNPEEPGEAVLVVGPRGGNKRFGEIILAGLALGVGLAVMGMGLAEALA